VDSFQDHVDPNRWRIEMLVRNSGFPIERGRDSFGLCFGGPNLNGKTVSIRSDGARLVMQVPALVLAEMRREAEDGATAYQVSENGLISFDPEGPFAEMPIKRAAALIRALPDTPLAIFREKTKSMPATTEVERLARQRVGQDIFRASLEDYWGGMCPLTGISDRALLRASHIKPWAECASDDERLDVYNGFLIAVHLDAAFDAALMTFNENGQILWSSKLTTGAKKLLSSGLVEPVILAEQHQRYLDCHRERFRLSQQ